MQCVSVVYLNGLWTVVLCHICWRTISGFNFHTSTGILGEGGREGGRGGGGEEGREGRLEEILFEMVLTNWNSVIAMVT